MKKMLALSLMLISFGALAGEIHVKVNGMVCTMCSQGIQKKFSKLQEVQHLNVDMDNKVVNITTKDGQDLPDEKITELITQAGYNVAGIERK